MATKKRANVISANVLAKAVDTAVSLASKRLDAKLENGTLALNWEIIGRQISGLKDMNQAMTIASEITKNVGVDGIKGQPVVTKFGGGARKTVGPWGLSSVEVNKVETVWPIKLKLSDGKEHISRIFLALLKTYRFGR